MREKTKKRNYKKRDEKMTNRKSKAIYRKEANTNRNKSKTNNTKPETGSITKMKELKRNETTIPETTRYEQAR